MNDTVSHVNLSIAVPVYNRPEDLKILLQSVLKMDFLPREVVLCEDNSPERNSIRVVVDDISGEFKKFGVVLKYIENLENLGYDANVRSLFRAASSDWVMLLGNDDVVLPNATKDIFRFISENKKIKFISRSFLRFSASIDTPLGISELSFRKPVAKAGEVEAGVLFRAAAFFGGLVINRLWAVEIETDRYDGTLYYQIYLSSHAFCQDGIGYIRPATVGGRTGNPPEFGSAKAESGVHIPGAYSAKGRAAMWRGVIRITSDAEKIFGFSLLKDIKKELAGRQSFHIFEMTSMYGRSKSFALARELMKLGLMSNPLPWVFVTFNIFFGRHALIFYSAARIMLQRNKSA